MSDLENLTNEQLAELKRQRYTEACESGIIASIGKVCCELGSDPAGRGFASTYGPKHTLPIGDVTIYVDGYGGYMTVHAGGRKVCSTHTCDRLFIPGPWVDAVLARLPEATAKAEAREGVQAATERKQLLGDVQ